MTYFSLRKRAPEPEEVEPEETEEEQQEEAEETEDGPAAKAHHPIVTGLLGPGTWIAAKAGTGLAWGVHIGSAWAVVYYGGWVSVVMPIVWAVAVLAFVPRDFLERTATAVDGFDVRRRKTAPEPPVEAKPEDYRETVRRLLLDLIGEARGVHLRTVLAHLQEHGQWEGRTVAELRVHLEALHIPVRPKVKVAGTPTRGVLRADLDAPSPVAETSPSPAPSPPV